MLHIPKFNSNHLFKLYTTRTFEYRFLNLFNKNYGRFTNLRNAFLGFRVFNDLIFKHCLFDLIIMEVMPK
ncbi:hypothetical protein GFO_0175 [Christiangramia forsetii KT0803]|uniref:Uncharacterized protein n=1 Tax=Christiangramia forsetii (strain DSM 17595 / CGMCC 1.15422 / KT0803) TaxID=411154 RepID=A0LXR7_CHRFK|nr:hypothetical protein GFO_0175 [Christiangramia forsetii KT0803]